MIDAIATRRTTLNGKTYEKGDKVALSPQQFEELKPLKRFVRATGAKKAASPAKTEPTRSSDTAD